jgi:FeS assembly SUF system protein
MFSFFNKDPKPSDAPAAEAATVGAQHTAPVPPGGTPELRPEPAAAIPDPPADFDVSALIEPTPAVSSKAFAPVVADAEATQELKPRVVQAISTVFDPEIPVNIFELGLVYDIRVGADRRVWIDMTLTSPNCPSAQSLPHEVQYKTKAVPGVADAHVEIVWEPPWSMEKMSDAARLQLGLL